MVVGLMKLEIWLDGNSTLQYKRSVVQKIKDRVKQKFNTAVAQVDEDSDNPDYATIGLSVVGMETAIIQATISKILSFIDSMSLGRVEEERTEVFRFDD